MNYPTSAILLLADGLKKLLRNPNCKGFLIILDNLDRCPPEVAKKLFIDYAAQLQELHCSIIYTVPISILYTAPGLNTCFGDPHIVPMVNIYQIDRRQKYPLRINHFDSYKMSRIYFIGRLINSLMIRS